MNKQLSTFAKENISKKEILFIKKNLTKSTFLEWLRENYSALRCFHACRPVNVQLYYENGFKPSVLENSMASFTELLTKVSYNGNVDVKETMDLFSGRSDRFVYLILDPYDFIDMAPHYWIYGSEFMLCLAQNTASHLKYYLRQTGIPTIFKCDVLLTQIDDTELIQLFDRIKNASGTLSQMLNDIFSNYTVIIDGTLEADCIVGHEHPTDQVYDAHAGEYYTNTIAHCSLCQPRLSGTVV